MQRTIPFFVQAHTAQGAINLLHSNVKDLERIIGLYHPAPDVLTAFFHELIHLYDKEVVEIIHSSYNPTWIDGIIVRRDAIAYMTIHSLPRDVQTHIEIDITPFFPYELSDRRNSDIAVQKELYQHAYKHFNNSLAIHEQLEKIYVKEMDFAEANNIAQTLIEELFSEKESIKKNHIVYERFFGTNSGEGLVHFVSELIEPIDRRIFLKGRAGTGKSTLMNKVLSAAVEKNYSCEKYRCSFDPNSVDMIVIRELDCCIFDSSPPHEFFPERSNDQLIDLFEKTVNIHVEKTYRNEIEYFQKMYKSEMKKGIEKLKEAQQMLEKAYEPTDISNVRMKEIAEMIIVSNF